MEELKEVEEPKQKQEIKIIHLYIYSRIKENHKQNVLYPKEVMETIRRIIKIPNKHLWEIMEEMHDMKLIRIDNRKVINILNIEKSQMRRLTFALW